MKIFIDSANPEEIKTAMSWGIVDGVTTNLSLATKAGIRFRDAVEGVLQLVKGTVSLEVISTEEKWMVQEVRKLTKSGEQVVEKLQTTFEGLKALKKLRSEGVKINMTLVFSVTQALFVAKQRATYVSPFVGRMDDMATFTGQGLVEEIVQVYENYDFETRILYASVRNLEYVKHAALTGVDVATMPFKVIEDLVRHKMTDEGLERFLADWEAAGQEALV